MIFIVFYTHDDNDIAAVMSVPDNDIAESVSDIEEGWSCQIPTMTKQFSVSRTRHSRLGAISAFS